MSDWSTTTTYVPVVKQYKTVKGLPSNVDKEVMELINDGWHVHGLPQKMNIHGIDLLVQGMVKYIKDEK